MTAQTYTAEVVVLGKRAIGEADLVLTMMDSRGSKVEAVAKGSRKPQSAASSRMELFNHAEALFAKGRSLDILKESRLLCAHDILHTDPAYGSAAACIAEFAKKTIQPELEAPRMFQLTNAAFKAASDAKVPQLMMVVGAYVLKASSFLGMRPCFDACVSCGDRAPMTRIAYQEGGAVCEACASQCESLVVPEGLLEWCNSILMATFQEILATEPDAILSGDIMRVASQWALHHAGFKLKSATQLYTYCSMLPQ